MTVGADIMEQFMLRYGPPAGSDGPSLFVREIYGARPDRWQDDTLQAYGAGERKISIRSCNGPGKSTILSWCAGHQLVCRFPQKTAATAPTVTQMYDAFYAECKTWLKKLPPPLYALLDIKAERIELIGAREESFLSVKTAKAEQPEALQGIHSAGFVLLMVDEWSGVPDSILEAAVGSMSGQHVTLIGAGNPLRSVGKFHESQTRAPGWKRFHITAVQSHDNTYPPGTYFSPRPGPAFIQQVIEDFGVDSNAYRVRCLGEFPKVDFDGIIPFELVESARTRDVRMTTMAPIVWGLDVARFGDDATALCKRQGNYLLEPIRTWHELDTMQVVGMVKHEYESCSPTQKPVEILVDVIGLGAGVVDRLRELKLPCRGINVSELPSLNPDRYVNLRTEGWFLMKEWFAARDVVIGNDDKLQAELVAQRYKIMNSNGKVLATPKADMRRDLHRSPDRADALMLTFCGTAATALFGAGAWAWDKPVLRNAAVV